MNVKKIEKNVNIKENNVKKNDVIKNLTELQEKMKEILDD